MHFEKGKGARAAPREKEKTCSPKRLIPASRRRPPRRGAVVKKDAVSRKRMRAADRERSQAALFAQGIEKRSENRTLC